MAPIPSDLEIAQAANPLPISDLAASIGIEGSELIPYGWTKAKVNLDILKRIGDRRRGKYIDVTAITPTPLGEGKTTTTVGLVRAGSGKTRPPRHRLHPSALDGPHVRHQGRCRGRRLQPGRPDGRVQPPPHR